MSDSQRPLPSVRQRLLPLVLLAGDAAMVLGGLLVGYWLRYRTPWGMVFVEVQNARLSDYLPLVFMGTAFLVGAFAHLNLYDGRLLLRRYQAMNIILKGTAFWFAAYLGVSLVLRFDPPISRLFVVFGCAATLLFLYAWRSLFYAVVTGVPAWRERLRQRTALLGWNADARAFADELGEASAHPLRLVGVIGMPGESGAPLPEGLPELGGLDELPEVLRAHRIDVLVVARLDLPREEFARLVAACERCYVELKVIPSVFQIFVSGLRLQTVGR
ncbi:MAG TPA: hypothetical protein PL015_13745, partial [Opitutaceae bacterium]|nr:hypothetical protein [Opitutaceae bacterium]